MRLPFHLVTHSLTGNRMLLASGSTLVLVDSMTGSIIAGTSTEMADSASSGQSNAPPIKDRIRATTWNESSSTIACVTDCKHIQLRDGTNLSLVNNRDSLKRCSSVLISRDDQHVLVGDKFGDVYQYPAMDPSTKRIQLMLGHVSLLTDMAWSHDGKFILTADRDEKIRVSHYPNTFVIERFCLGHQQFISRILVIPHTEGFAISGGGDPYLLVWDYLSGNIVQKITLDEGEVKPPVLAIKYAHKSKTLAIAFEQVPHILLLDATHPGKYTTKQILKTPQAPLDAAFDNEGHLWIVYAQDEQTGPLVGISELKDGIYQDPSSTHHLVQNVSNYATSQTETMPDYFEVKNLGKFLVGTSHYHKKKDDQKLKRDQVLESRSKRQSEKRENEMRSGVDGGVGDVKRIKVDGDDTVTECA